MKNILITVLIAITALLTLSCNKKNKEEWCIIGAQENVFDKDDIYTAELHGGTHPGKVRFNEGWAYKGTLDFNKIAITGHRYSENRNGIGKFIAILLPEPESYPYTFVYDYDYTNPEKDNYSNFVHGTNYTEEKACTLGYDSGLIYPNKSVYDIEQKIVKGYVTVEKFGDVGDYIIGNFELEFEDMHGNNRKLKNGYFKIKRKPDRH